MLLRNVALGALSVLVGGLLTPMLITVDVASADTEPNVSSRYRYAGVVENGRGIPTHYIAAGDGIRFHFFDALSQGRPSESYTLCIGRPRMTPVRCWHRTAKYGVGEVGFSFTLPSVVPLGALTARWLSDGRVVASWPFFYTRGG